MQKKARRISGKDKKKGSKIWLISALVAAIAAIGGGIYYFFTQKKEKESTVPPRVEDFSSPSAPQGSTLVYTSTTEDDAKRGSDLAEEGVVERDEELLGSLDEQLAKHREEETAIQDAVETEIEVSNADKKDADTSRITDDHESEGKHRLQTEDDN